MKNIKVSMLALSLVAVSASASNGPEVVTSSTGVAPVAASASWFKMPSLPKVSMPNLPVMPESIAKLSTVQKTGLVAGGVAATAVVGYLTYKYGKTVCKKIASATKVVLNKAIEHKYKVLATAVVAVAAVAGYKYGVHTMISDKVAALVAAAKARFVKAPVAPVETPKEN